MAAITSAAIGLGTAAYGIYNSEKQRKSAQKDLNDYDRQVLDNAFSDIPINTAGSDLLREQSAQSSANMVDALQAGGSRAIIGGLPKVGAYTNQIDQQAARLLDDQYQRRDYAAAQDNARIEGITENRDNSNINALSSQVQSGKQGVWDGIMGIGSSIGYGARNYNQSPNPTANSIGNIQPMGVQPSPNMPIQATPLQSYPAANLNPGAQQYPSPYFDFSNSYQPAQNTDFGPQQYNPFFNFGTSYNGY